MVGLQGLKAFSGTGILRPSLCLLLITALWISGFLSTSMVCLEYTRSDIIGIGLSHNHSCSDLRILRKNGICSVPSRRGCRGSGHKKPIPTLWSSRTDIPFDTRGVNAQNLTSVKIVNSPEQSPNMNNVKFGLLNARSVNKKCLAISDYIVENELDLVALTETWMGPEGNDTVVASRLQTPPCFSVY